MLDPQKGNIEKTITPSKKDLAKQEGITAARLNAHGGLFKVKGVASQCLADALNCAVSVSSAAGEGGAWGMALLSAYAILGKGAPLDQWLEEAVFASVTGETVAPIPENVVGFNVYMERYGEGLAAQRVIK